MTYRNKRTGAVIDCPCVVSGEDWEEVSAREPKPETDAEKPPKRAEK